MTFPSLQRSAPSAAGASQERDVRLLLGGVALSAAGNAIYLPLVLAQTGLAFSPLWASAVMFAVNAGRVGGSWLSARREAFAPRSPLAAIVLEGVALASMAFAEHPAAIVVAATVAGFGAGCSYPALKHHLILLAPDGKSRLFARLSIALRYGMAFGYLAGAAAAGLGLRTVLLGASGLFAAYALVVQVALRAHRRTPTARTASVARTAAPRVVLGGAQGAAGTIGIVAFWFLATQPIVLMSLYVPRYLPAVPVSMVFWVSTAVAIGMQHRVTSLADGERGHERLVMFGFALMALTFLAMTVGHPTVIALLCSTIAWAASQAFYGPSLDFLVCEGARRRGGAIDAAMSRQQMSQTLGVMFGSWFAGVLFECGERIGRPAFSGSVLAALSVAALAFVSLGTMRRRRGSPATRSP